MISLDSLIRDVVVDGRSYAAVHVAGLAGVYASAPSRLPFSLKILAENMVRNILWGRLAPENLTRLLSWRPEGFAPVGISFYPARVLMQDFTGVPALCDLAAMRDAAVKAGFPAERINPEVPVDLIIDHSVQVDFFGMKGALEKNVGLEFDRNRERYAFLKWAQKSFDNLKIVPPNSGICHQINLEKLGTVAVSNTYKDRAWAFPDSLVGTDSHTPMINALGTLGWGVGGIEAEAVMMGQPLSMRLPSVTGVRICGTPDKGVTATDVVLYVTERLRQEVVVEQFVEYFGPSLSALSLPDRATIANMTPENGATVGLFPVDEVTIEYLRATGRDDAARFAEAYAKEAGLFHDPAEEPSYNRVIELDLSDIAPSVAGPARPQDRIPLQKLKPAMQAAFGGGKKGRDISMDGKLCRVQDGSVVIAAITSCTNTSNPHVMLGAGLIAKKASALGLSIPPYVKTSLAPGSKAVVKYLEDAGLMTPLESLGFHLAGFGCTTCIGNSGPLPPKVAHVVEEENLNVSAVLSGNRNFEARIHQKVRSNFLASPMLVVLFALAGRTDIDLMHERIGCTPEGKEIFMADLWPSREEIDAVVARCISPATFTSTYASLYDGDAHWQGIDSGSGLTFDWDKASTYIRKPPFFDDFSLTPPAMENITDARVLAKLGDSVTTDHISPAGAIPPSYPAGAYLTDQGVTPDAYNSYGSRRGNHEVMMRGTFGNIRIKNELAHGREGAYTTLFPDHEERFIFDAAQTYGKHRTPLVVLAGTEYGTGSSRDWAAKGSLLLGIRAVIAESFERIHRSNLVGMGVLPLEFMEDESARTLNLNGTETFSLSGLDTLEAGGTLSVRAQKETGQAILFGVKVRLDTAKEVETYRHGGILPMVLRELLEK
ncbi:aconitate hydratase AcnA [Desulfoluna spongiiphila]|uniref:aconitate hydratase AcnA n=1 Tax=Desulfoluna spongiiphila TaxID=419481 RepID=UPI00125C0B5F|nr:aconitate hydratase AcnA [Desulfoluna spongiiphila]VVS93646.1 aconitase/3-isopropylmalate dehydratase swivel [Desulfoluna spongiiphila]